LPPGAIFLTPRCDIVSGKIDSNGKRRLTITGPSWSKR